MHVTDFPDIIKLSTAEKILLVEDLWETIIADEPSIPVPESHVAELDRRLNNMNAFPGSLLTLDELKSRIGKKK
jgi:putative addiction module component (TIGR02574 family)